ncbi:MAG: CocE/NonD family hydrolase [Anaerolineales bacterium]|nr:CocE/NonD family hydrolase [Anaerolineales bacterium]
MLDEYTDDEINHCIQVIDQIAHHPNCDGNVGMLGTSWSAINSLMVAAHPACPPALKAVLAMCGTDDRFNDDVHYKGGAMMQDNAGWAASMWGWLSAPPDPLVVGDRWQEMWRTRLQNAEFWFDHWAHHQTRDAYWTKSSTREQNNQFKVPVLILSGWEDGYKNPVLRVVEALAAADRPVVGLLGPWGHNSPDYGNPGPRINWLPYMMEHWWDRWLKGATPDPATELPQLTVWLGESKEPDPSPCYDDGGRWVAEDGAWSSRVVDEILYLHPNAVLSEAMPAEADSVAGTRRIIANAGHFETCSYGKCGNSDLLGDQQAADAHAMTFTTAPLTADLDCFGFPSVTLNLSCDQPMAALIVRVSEVSATTGAVHPVSYTFRNLCQQDEAMANPQMIAPDTPFTVTFPLDVLGHTFKRGWRIRLSVAASNFPTLWQSRTLPAITIHTGQAGGAQPSALHLPARQPRAEDAELARRLPSQTEIVWVDSSDYVPVEILREGEESRVMEPITINGKTGTLVKKHFDSGGARYGGPLAGLEVDLAAEENFQIIDDDPLSQVGFMKMTTTMQRPALNWRIRTETAARVWSEIAEDGQPVFKYLAELQAFIGPDDAPFEQRTVQGAIPRIWV